MFLVDRVPLVFQQKEVIAANCDLSVKHLCGEMVWDQWNEKLWDTMLKEDDVCVMTAQILLDAMRHGFILLDRVSHKLFVCQLWLVTTFILSCCSRHCSRHRFI